MRKGLKSNEDLINYGEKGPMLKMVKKSEQKPKIALYTPCPNYWNIPWNTQTKLYPSSPFDFIYFLEDLAGKEEVYPLRLADQSADKLKLSYLGLSFNLLPCSRAAESIVRLN